MTANSLIEPSRADPGAPTDGRTLAPLVDAERLLRRRLDPTETTASTATGCRP